MFNIYFKEMKKFISLIALVGVFTACNLEDLSTAFRVDPAVVTITASAQSAAPGFSESKVTWDPSKVVTISGTATNPVVEKGTVTIKATYATASASETVNYPTVYAGGTADLACVITIPYNAGDYTVTTADVPGEPAYEVEMLPAAAKGHGFAEYAVTVYGKSFTIPMLANDNEYSLVVPVEYQSYAEGGYQVNDDLNVTNPDFQVHAESLHASAVAAAPGIVATAVAKDQTFSAWSMFNFVNVIKTTNTTVNVIATPNGNAPALPNNGIVATFTKTTVESLAQPVEAAHPSHASHYEPGHGTGHGDGSNAGGGLVPADES